MATLPFPQQSAPPPIQHPSLNLYTLVPNIRAGMTATANIAPTHQIDV